MSADENGHDLRARQGRKEDQAHAQAQGERRAAIAADAAVAQDGQYLLAVPSAAKPIGGIGQSVFVKASRDADEIRENDHGRHKRRQMRTEQQGQHRRAAANDEPDDGKELGRSWQRVFGVRMCGHREACEELHRRQEVVPERGRTHAEASLTPADANVAICAYSATAASMIGKASTAPVPSPNRMSRVSSGCNSN